MSLGDLYFKKVETMKNNEMDHKYPEGKLCMTTNWNCPVGATVDSHLEKIPCKSLSKYHRSYHFSTSQHHYRTEIP